MWPVGNPMNIVLLIVLVPSLPEASRTANNLDLSEARLQGEGP